MPLSFLALAKISQTTQHEVRVSGRNNRPGSDHGADEESLTPVVTDEDNEADTTTINIDNDDIVVSSGCRSTLASSTTFTDSPLFLQQDLTNLAITSYSKRPRMIIHHFDGPNFISEDRSNYDNFHVTQKSVTVLVVLESDVDISTLTSALVVTPGRNAKITITVNQHRSMLDPKLVTPAESIGCHEVVNCVRVFLQDQQRRGLTVVKAEVTIPGDFEDWFIQPVRHASSSASCRYLAARLSSPFRISYVAGTSSNHTQGAILTSYLLHKLQRAPAAKRGTVGSMLPQHYGLPAASSTAESRASAASSSSSSTNTYSWPSSEQW